MKYLHILCDDCIQWMWLWCAIAMNNQVRKNKGIDRGLSVSSCHCRTCYISYVLSPNTTERHYGRHHEGLRPRTQDAHQISLNPVNGMPYSNIKGSLILQSPNCHLLSHLATTLAHATFARCRSTYARFAFKDFPELEALVRR